ncbi:hypothetical protein S40285_10930 [Stachybotrys chlorohalonatus IBT 40285]|uniref:Uncharacterized protein n=1 Tax=Stachybotrys chlorohalonatus (strain IBT 40285) TaxID=1283841 RepID=A0A084QYE2_STAC4|nr:hypothetical protein S40285_10930 [Stachybotrys chlorohalonata IBT 40285]
MKAEAESVSACC